MKNILILSFILLLPSCLPATIGGAVMGLGNTAHTNDQIKKLKKRVEKLEGHKIKMDKNHRKPGSSYCLSIDPRC